MVVNLGCQLATAVQSHCCRTFIYIYKTTLKNTSETSASVSDSGECVVQSDRTSNQLTRTSSSSRPGALAGKLPPTLALRRVIWSLNLCKYHSRVLNRQNSQKRSYYTKPEMAVAKWSTNVISALSSDTEPTIIITFENAKYIFNAGENTGRAWMQSRAHWRKMKALFFTQVGTQRMSGMPGTVLPPDASYDP